MDGQKNISYVILDDEPLFAAALEKRISRLRSNYRLLDKGDSVASSLELLKNPELDIVFSDIMLCDGLATEALRKSHCSKPVVFMTGDESRRQLVNGFNVVNFLLKPVSMDEIEQSIQKFENNINFNHNLNI